MALARGAAHGACEAIRAHKLRGFFTVLGTVFGVTFLIAVITLIEGMNQYVEKEFKGASLRREHGHAAPPPVDHHRRRRGAVARVAAPPAPHLRRRGVAGAAHGDAGRAGASPSNTGKALGPRGREVENVWITGATAS